MMMNVWSSLARLGFCLLAIAITCAVVFYGRGPLAAETRVAQAAAKAPGAKVPANEAEVKTPLVRSMLDTLSQLGDEQGTAEERRLVREQLLKADQQLAPVLGKNSRAKIIQANNRLPAFRVGPEGGAAMQPRGRMIPGARGVSGSR